MNKYDVIIIGGACAGMSAAIYTARRELKTLVLTKDIGGQLAITTDVENYPGFESIMGPELSMKFKSQAEKSGAEVKLSPVKSIKKDGDEYIVEADEEYQAPVVILSFGLKQRILDVLGEKKLIGRGVAYCATCDGPLYRGKKVGVVGGGSSAFDAAEYLANLAEEVHLFVRRDEYRAENVLIEAVQNASNVTIHNFTEIKEFIGENKLEKVKLLNNQTNEESELALDGVFIEIGWMSQVENFPGLKDLIEVNERGYVKIDNQSQTTSPGLYAAGDLTDTPFKQAVISAGEGAKAAMSAAHYLQKKNGSSGEISFNRKK